VKTEPSASSKGSNAINTNSNSVTPTKKNSIPSLTTLPTPIPSSNAAVNPLLPLSSSSSSSSLLSSDSKWSVVNVNDGVEYKGDPHGVRAPPTAIGSRGGTDVFSVKPSLSELIRPHVHSFNFLLQHSKSSSYTTSIFNQPNNYNLSHLLLDTH
jgi:hypothetical protein